MRTTPPHTAAPANYSRQKFVGSLLLLLLTAFSFLVGTPSKAARNWFARLGEVSAATTATPFATITVNTTTDDNTVNGNCTLREAISAANTNAAVDACTAGTAGLDTIRFNVGAGTPSIAVTGAGLPDITEPVIIDGATGGATRIELNGTAAGPDASGLVIRGGGSTIKAMVINRFEIDGIEIFDLGGNTIVNCYLGTDATGTMALPNLAGDGVFIFNSPNNTVGGTTAAERNLLSGNLNDGVDIFGAGSTGNKVIGNFIGTDVTGTVALGNLRGVEVADGPNNTIGGPMAGERNIICGNAAGVVISSAGGTGIAMGNKIIGNYIGVNVTGAVALGNNTGVSLGFRTMKNTVGGATPGERNIISGNAGNGITINGTGSSLVTGSNTISGNYIGTDVTGTVALGNGVYGVRVIDGNNLIGGTTPGERNLISGNGNLGIFIAGTAATGNKVSGNFIGTNANGTAALGNTLSGVQIQSPNNTVGGTTVGERNLISGNAQAGVFIATAAATGNKVTGNYIGTDVNGTAALRNLFDGVNLQANNNTVGGTTAAERNLIVGNGRNGVYVAVATATGNQVLGNSIFNNTALGIDLFPLGLSANDAGDAEAGANNLQNFPVLTGLTNTTITGTLDSLPANTSYPVRLEFFANTAADASGNGEGEVFLGATSLAAPGAFTFNYTPVAGKPFITATATDNVGNTSEFSPALTGAPTVAISDPFSCSGPGNALTVRVAISNPAVTTQTVRFTAALPEGLVGVPGSGTSSVGTAPAVSATSATFTATLTAGQTANVTYQVQVGDTVAGGTPLCITTTSAVGTSAGPAVQACATVNCPAAGPGALPTATSPLNAQRPGSVLIFNVFTSSAAAPNQQNTRLSLTNTHPVNNSYVHLFFVDGASCSVADAFVCLTPNQTASFLAADLDPGTSGYVVAVAVNATGCPINFNYLIGDEYVKFSSGHAANLGAEAVTAIAGGLPGCDGNATTAELRFDGVSYSVLPTVLAASNVGSRADGNETLLILNRLGGNLATGAATVGSVFGILYDDTEAPLSFSIAVNACQWRNVLSGSTIRTVPRYEQFIPAGRTGWLKLAATNLSALTGAVLNFNANAAAQGGAFNQGRNLHKLTTTNTATLTIPVFPPGC